MADNIEVSLPREMLEIIEQRVRSGEYESPSEVLREALSLWLEQQDVHAFSAKAMRARVAQTFSDPRPSVPADEAFARVRQAVRGFGKA